MPTTTKTAAKKADARVASKRNVIDALDEVDRAVAAGIAPADLLAAQEERTKKTRQPRPRVKYADIETLRAIAAGTAFSAEVENDLEARGLIVQTDQPYAQLTDTGRKVAGLGEPEASHGDRRALGPRPGGALADALTVLKGARRPMTPQAIYDAGRARGLFEGLKGKTPVATLQAQLAVANRKGLYVERPEPGRYKARKAAKA
jgi:hypothetical protein